MPFATLEGVRRGCRGRGVCGSGRGAADRRLARPVINAMGEPIDGKGRCRPGLYLTRSSDAPARIAPTRRRADRSRGRSLNTFVTCCHGQRMGIFAGSGAASRCWLVLLS